MDGAQSLRQVAHSRAPLSAWLGIVLLFVLFGVIVLAIIGPTPRGSDYEEMRAKKRSENLKTLREEDHKTLTTYGWTDKSKGVAHIPIERAMKLTVAELAAQRPAPAGPIATPGTQATESGASPAASSAPAAAGTPQPSTSPAASPSAQASASPSAAAQSSQSGPASPSPTKSP